METRRAAAAVAVVVAVVAAGIVFAPSLLQYHHAGSDAELTRRMKNWIAGTTIDEAMDSVREYNKEGIHVILNVLGEHEQDDAVSRTYVKQYLSVIDTIARDKLDAMISVKPTALGMDSSGQSERFARNLRSVVAAAVENRVRVCIDMEDPAHHKVTIDTVVQLLEEFGTGGYIRVAIQADLVDAVDEVTLLMDKGASVRLCRGAYGKWKQELPRLKTPEEIDGNFVACAKIAAERGKHRSALATHDPAMLKKIHAVVAPDAFEHEVLHSPQALQQLAMFREELGAKRGSVYIPFGTNWYGYCSRRDPWFETHVRRAE